MKSNQQLLSGRNIYLDRKGQYVYYNKRNKIGYRIPIEKIGKYRFLQTRYMMALVTYILLSEFMGLPTAVGLMIGLAVLAYTTFDYYKRFLPNLTQFHNYTPDEGLGEIDLLMKEDTARLYTKVFLYIIFGILLILNVFISESSLILFLGSGIVAVFAWQLAFKHIIAIKRKKA